MTNKELLDRVNSMIYDDENIMLANGFEDAFLGIARQFNRPPFAVYSRNKCIEILIESGMDECDAEEYFAFNIEGAYVGDSTPAFMT